MYRKQLAMMSTVILRMPGSDASAPLPSPSSNIPTPDAALAPRAVSASLPASRLKVRINHRLTGADRSGSQSSTPVQSWHATPRWPAEPASSQTSPAADHVAFSQPADSSASPVAQDGPPGSRSQAGRSESEPVMSSEGAAPGPATGRSTMLSRFHMPPLSFGRRGSAAIPTTAVRSAGELPLGGKVLPVNPNKSKAAAALFEIASHPSPLQRQPSTHANQASSASNNQAAAPADSEGSMISGNQDLAEPSPGPPVIPRSPLKLREIDAKVSGPTQQLLAVLHGLQSELESAGSRQQSVQVAVEQLEEQLSGVKEQLQSETSSLADDQNTVNVLRSKAVAVEEELEFVDAEVAAKQTAVTSSMSQLQLKESLLADKDTIIAQLSKQVRQAAGDGFGRIFGGLFRRPAQGSTTPQHPSTDGQ
ncbi:hypothetical protein WJX84_004473 [Apatococcus fuscideae]|uniref:Uncharacterized protein n=1 Tax=Apatococcus fuscideae TaxID=2026836 RepID=A0AAW1REV9_9CHLO